MNFKWDSDKRISNVRKHGIDFYDATNIFRGPVLKYPDVDHSDEEARFHAIG